MGSILSKPKAPPVAPPTVMPVPDDEAEKRKKRQMAAQRMNASGRQSTMLTEAAGIDAPSGSTTLGG